EDRSGGVARAAGCRSGRPGHTADRGPDPRGFVLDAAEPGRQLRGAAGGGHICGNGRPGARSSFARRGALPVRGERPWRPRHTPTQHRYVQRRGAHRSPQPIGRACRHTFPALRHRLHGPALCQRAGRDGAAAAGGPGLGGALGLDQRRDERRAPCPTLRLHARGGAKVRQGLAVSVPPRRL
ncbi:MAG: 16S rRNA (guanine(966)-N(2))-methyltransferase, partial [uncultured Sphingosinicella sp.]